VPYLLAFSFNTKFDTNEDKIIRNFDADKVIAMILEVKGNNFLIYWGKINWLLKPTYHECFQSYKDPFYALFKFENKQVNIVEASLAITIKMILTVNIGLLLT